MSSVVKLNIFVLRSHQRLLLHQSPKFVNFAGVGLTFQLGAPLFVTLLLLGLWVAAVGALCVVPHSPPTFSFEKVFHVPGFPVVPALGILVNTHLFCSLGWATQAQFAVWTLIGLATYVLYSVKSAAEADESSLDRYASFLCVATMPDDRAHALCRGAICWPDNVSPLPPPHVQARVGLWYSICASRTDMTRALTWSAFALNRAL